MFEPGIKPENLQISDDDVKHSICMVNCKMYHTEDEVILLHAAEGYLKAKEILNEIAQWDNKLTGNFSKSAYFAEKARGFFEWLSGVKK